MFLTFGEFAPDVADLGTDTLDTARNVFPAVNSWRPVKSLLAQSTPLPSACKGLADAPQASGAFDTYAGTATKLYRFNSATQDWIDVSRLVGGNYTISTGGFWSFAQFGALLIATNGVDVVQVINVDSGTNFAALGGSPPFARQVTVVEDRVVLSNLAVYPTSIAWSDINDATAWTPGGASLADMQEFSGGGDVQAVCSAARLVLQERGLRSIIPTGDVTSFQFEEVASAKGTISHRSVVQVGSLAFWLSEDGFYMGNSSEQRAISANRVANYFFGRLHRPRQGQTQGVADPLATRVYWAYPTGDSDLNDYVIGYDWSLDRWFEMQIDTYALSNTATAGVTLESLDSISASLDALLLSLDSSAWLGGIPTFSAIDASSKLAYFEGAPLEAVLETGNHQLVAGLRSKAIWARPLIEGDGGSALTVSVGRRQRLADSVLWTSPSPMATSGRVPLYASGAYHRFRMTIPTGSDWLHTQGLDIDFVQEGVR